MIFLATFKSIMWCVQVKGRRLRIILIHRGLQINQVEHTCLFWRYGHWFLFILFHRLILQNERDKMQGIRMNMVLLNRLLTCILRSFDLLRFYFTIFQTIIGFTRLRECAYNYNKLLNPQVYPISFLLMPNIPGILLILYCTIHSC